MIHYYSPRSHELYIARDPYGPPIIDIIYKNPKEFLRLRPATLRAKVEPTDRAAKYDDPFVGITVVPNAFDPTVRAEDYLSKAKNMFGYNEPNILFSQQLVDTDRDAREVGTSAIVKSCQLLPQALTHPSLPLALSLSVLIHCRSPLPL
jgi:hypothetical protein